MKWVRISGAFIAFTASVFAQASETVAYSYDAQGRLTTVVRSGTVNNGVQTTHSFDNADNRTKVIVTGGVSRVVVVPLNGLTVIPIPDP